MNHITNTQPQNEVAAWELPEVISFFEDKRNKPSEVYPSEQHFLGQILREGVSILDVGCALGGFSSIISEHIQNFRYVGVDTNPRMIHRAKEKFPQHTFHHMTEMDFSAVGGEKFDIVLCLGVLHLTVTWRRLMQICWEHTRGHLLLDMRESSEPSIDGRPDLSHFNLDFFGGETPTILPYNVINSGDSLATLQETCVGLTQMYSYGYFHKPSPSVVSPVNRVFMRTYLIQK